MKAREARKHLCDLFETRGDHARHYDALFKFIDQVELTETADQPAPTEPRHRDESVWDARAAAHAKTAPRGAPRFAGSRTELVPADEAEARRVMSRIPSLPAAKTASPCLVAIGLSESFTYGPDGRRQDLYCHDCKSSECEHVQRALKE